jgi:thioredoxin reductase (NADPH)
MMEFFGPALWIYAVPAAAIWCLYFLRTRAKERIARDLLDESVAAQLLEPPSLHPVIDPNLCAGCGACAGACPEGAGEVLGVISGKATLVSPTSCIGHGACKDACPMQAIELVFGTATRGVDIPYVDPEFESNVPGVFIAGELGGMGLVRNAIEQGRQAMEAISRKRPRGRLPVLDVLIVGGGPAGLAATLAAHELGLRYRTIEQESVGGAVAHYPRGKIVMTQPVVLPIYGRVESGEIQKEALLALWRDVEERTGIEIHCGERMESLSAATFDGDTITVTTTQGKYETQAVLLCIGRRGSPQKLGVPGEDLCKVVYRLADADQYCRRHVTVVGGGDSALEAAIELSLAGAASVALVHRGEVFDRARPKNRRRVQECARRGDLEILLESRVVAISENEIEIDVAGTRQQRWNDGLIVCTGGVLPTELLRAVGIRFESKYGTR